MNLARLPQLLQQAFSGVAAQRHVAEIARHHRIQASPGYRAAAAWLAGVLQQAGVAAHIERFPAAVGVSFWALPAFQEWECRAATLDWLRQDGSERLCDYRALPLALIQRSASVSGEFEVVDVGDGEPEAYAGVDVAGKLALSRSAVRQTYDLAVRERGAAGVLYDHITADSPGRSRAHLPDARQYSSFWWREEDDKGWGFVLSPRQGDALRQALDRGESVRLRAHIDARFYDGEYEVVVATIPGKDASSYVLGMAHLCHPQGFANDNASGAACLLETAVTLNRLIAGGQLAQPQRTLLFLWMPEMTGAYAWLAGHEDVIPHIVAGLNLDMVGEDQAITGSVLLVEHPPQAMASFAPHLLERLRQELLHNHHTLGGNDAFPLIRVAATGFSGGSDHMVSSDPAVGVPTPMLIQWPDRFYHTSADTLENVDPDSLALAGALAGSYLYWLSCAGWAEARWLGWEMVARYERRLGQELQDQTTRLLALGAEEKVRAWQRIIARAEFLQDRAHAALATLARLADVSAILPLWQLEVEGSTDRVLDRSRKLAQPWTLPAIAPAPDDGRMRAGHAIPLRRYRGPIMDLASPHPPFALAPAAAASWRQLYADTSNWRMVRVLAEYWADGRRSLAEIARLVELETGKQLGPQIETYFLLLQQAGLLAMIEPEA